MLNRQSFLLVYEAKFANPNGDTVDNIPNHDPYSGHGFVTDCCIKRKIRDIILEDYAEEKGMAIYVRPGVSYEQSNDLVAAEIGAETEKDRRSRRDEMAARFCALFSDNRSFGVVPGSSGGNAAVTGPVSLEFGFSVDPINIISVEHTRVSQTREDDQGTKNGHGTFGGKHVVAYGLYTQWIHLDPYRAKNTGFSKKDLEVLKTVLPQIFTRSRSAARAGMRMRRVYHFEQETALGEAPDIQVDEAVVIQRKNPEKPFPVSFADYTLEVRKVPKVTCQDLIQWS